MSLRTWKCFVEDRGIFKPSTPRFCHWIYATARWNDWHWRYVDEFTFIMDDYGNATEINSDNYHFLSSPYWGIFFVSDVGYPLENYHV